MQASACWTEGLALPDTLKVLEDLALLILRDAGERGAPIAELIRLHRWSDVVNFEITYDKDWDVLQLIAVRQALGLFSKLEPLDIGVDKIAAARETFFDANGCCCETNAIFKAVDAGRASLVPAVVRLIESARRKIKSVLGVCPKADSLRFHFGPGATTVTKKNESCPTVKMAAGFQCSPSLLASGLLPTILREVPHWSAEFETGYSIDDEGYLVAQVDVEVVPCRLTFVPKSCKTYRSIAVEPCLNSFFQQGLRHAIEDRLRLYGLSTNDQARNQRLARVGSLTGELATIDLSSASDRISFELVKRLLPADWFRLLNAARSGHVLCDGAEHDLSMFYSSGNACTFPLETLLFWSISTSAMDIAGLHYDRESVAVYGDDIIVPSVAYDAVSEALCYLGFKVNAKKSFASGPFRESCGADYYKGFAIRPFHQKSLVSGESLFTMHNFFVRRYMHEWASWVVPFIHPATVLYGPDGYGDGHLLNDEWVKIIHPKLLAKGYGGYSFDTYRHKGRKYLSPYPGDHVSPLYSIYNSGRSLIHPLVPLLESTETEQTRSGRPLWPTPGTDGYRKYSIYTLAAN